MIFGFVVSCELKLFGPRNKFVHHAGGVVFVVSSEPKYLSRFLPKSKGEEESEASLSDVGGSPAT